MSERESLFSDTFKVFWIVNRETGQVHSLGPMYGGTIDYARRKLEAENLPYAWILLAPVARTAE